MGKLKRKTQALTSSRTSERISILKMQVFMLIATFLLLGQTKGRKPLGLSSLTNETGLVAELEKFVTEVESKLWALQTSVDDINENVDDIKDNAKINNECCDKKYDDKCEKYRGTMNVGRDGNTCKLCKT